MSDYTKGGRLPTIKEMSGSVHYGGRVVFEDGEPVVLTPEESHVVEHRRLEVAVLESARAWALQTEAEMITKGDRNELFDYEIPLFDAAASLVEFERKQK